MVVASVLEILGIIFLLILLVVVGAAGFIWLKFRQIKKLVGELSGLEMSSEVTLERDPDPSWMNQERVETPRDALQQRGFSFANAYSIKEMPAIRMAHFYHSQSPLMVVLYHADNIGDWLDLVIEYDDGTALTVSNAPMGGELDHRPGAEKVYQPDADVDTLFAIFEEKRASEKATKPISPELFAGRFEDFYKAEMAWRNQKGGTSYDEIERIARQMGEDMSGEERNAAYESIKQAELDSWHAEGTEQFKSESLMPVNEWRKYEDRIFLVGESIAPEVFVPYLEDFLALSDEEFEKYEERVREAEEKPTAPELFELINDRLPEAKRARKLGEINKPIHAQIWGVDYDRYEDV